MKDKVICQLVCRCRSRGSSIAREGFRLRGPVVCCGLCQGGYLCSQTCDVASDFARGLQFRQRIAMNQVVERRKALLVVGRRQLKIRRRSAGVLLGSRYNRGRVCRIGVRAVA